MNKKVIIGAVTSTTVAVGVPIGLIVGQKLGEDPDTTAKNANNTPTVTTDTTPPDVVAVLKDTTTSLDTIEASLIPEKIVTKEELGITLIPPQGVTFTYEVLDNTGDGFLIVKVTAKKGAQEFPPKNITVAGFQTKRQRNLLEVTSIKNSFIDQTTRKGTVEASTIPIGIALGDGGISSEQLGITLTLSKQVRSDKEVKYTYEVTDNTGDGFLDVKVTATKGSGVDEASAFKVIRVNGFLTAIGKANPLINETVTNAVINIVEWPPSKLVTTFPTLSPSSFSNGPTTTKDLGITIPEQPGIAYDYKIVSTNKELGEVKVKVTLKSGPIIKTVLILVTEFKTQDQVDQEAVTSVISQIKGKDLSTTRTSDQASKIPMGIASGNDLGVFPVCPSGITFSYEVVDNTGDGFLRVKVTVKQGKAVATIHTPIKVNGYLTELAHGNAIVPKAANALQDAITKFGNMQSSAFNSGPTTEGKLGIKINKNPEITYEFQVLPNGISDGEVDVQVTLTSGPVTQVRTLRVLGFKTQDQVDREAISTVIHSLNDEVTTKTGVKASEISIGSAKAIDLGISWIPPVDTTFDYEVIDNTGDGFVSVKVTATKGGATDTKTIKITGFLSPRSIEEAKIVKAINALPMIPKTTLNTKFSSSFTNGPTTQQALGITIPEQPGIKYEYRINGTEDGEVEVEISLTSGSVTKTKTIKIIGFKSQSQADKDVVDAITKSLSDQILTSKTSVEASLIPIGLASASDLGIFIRHPVAVSFTYEVTDNTGDGFLRVKVTTKQHSAQSSKLIQVNGYLTALKKGNLVVPLAIGLLSNTVPTTLKNTVPSSFTNGPTTAKDLGITISEQSGIKYEYKVVGTDDGTVDVAVTLTSGSVTKTKTIKVTGFKTNAQANQDAVELAVNSLNNQQTTNGAVSSSTIPKGKISDVNLGISLTPPVGVTYTYEVIDNSGNGVVKVKVTATKGAAHASNVITVSGFLSTTINPGIAVPQAFNKIADVYPTSTPNTLTSTFQLGLTSPKALGITIKQDPGVSYKYILSAVTDTDVTVEVTVSSGEVTHSLTIKKKTIKVTGFKTQDQIDLDLVTKIVGLLKSQPTFKIAEQSIPKGQTTAQELGINPIDPLVLDGATVDYVVDTQKDGSDMVKVTVTKGGISKVIVIEVNNFKTNSRVNQDAVTKILGLIIDQPTFLTFKQSIVVGSTTPQQLGINPIDPLVLDGATIDYVVETQSDGSNIVKATVTKGGESGTTTFEVNDFKSQAEVDREIVEAEVKKIPDELQVLPVMDDIDAFSIPTGTITAFQLGVTPLASSSSGVTFTYRVIDDTKDGFLTVEVTIRKGQETTTKTIKVNGFLTKLAKATKDVNDAMNAISDKVTTLTSTLATTLSIGTTLPAMLGITIIEQPNVNYNYEITIISPGEVDVIVTLTSGSVHQTKSFKVTGFETQSNVDKKSIAKILGLILDQPTTQTAQESIPVGSTTAQELGITPIDPSILDGATVDYEVITKNNGSDIVKATVTKGSESDTTTFEVISFRTKEQADQERVRTIIMNLLDQPTILGSTGADSIPTGQASASDMGISLVPPSDVKLTYNVTDNKGDGFLEVEVTATKGSATEVGTIKVTGFLVELTKSIAKVTNAIGLLSDVKTTSKTKLAASFNIGPTTQQALGTSIVEQAGVKYNWKVIATNVGDVTVEVTLSSGLAQPQTKVIHVTDFKSTQSQTIYIYNKIEYKTRAEAEAAAGAAEEGRIQDKTIYSFDKKNYMTQKDAQAAQVLASPPLSQVWTNGVAPADGTKAPTVTTDHIVYEYNGRVYELEDQAKDMWVKEHSHQEILGSATIQYDGHDLPPLSIDQSSASTYSSEADVKKEYSGKLSWSKTTTTGAAAKVMPGVATKFTKAQVLQELSTPVNGQYTIDGKIYQKVISPKTGKIGTIRDVIAASKSPIYEFSENGQDYVAVTHFDPDDAKDDWVFALPPSVSGSKSHVPISEGDKSRIPNDTDTNKILDFFDAIREKQYLSESHLKAFGTFVLARSESQLGGWGTYTPITPIAGVQLILNSLKHLKVENNIDVYETEFKNYINNKPSAHTDQPYYDMFESIIPRGEFGVGGGVTSRGGAIKALAAENDFQYFHMSTKNLDAIISYLEIHEGESIYTYTPNQDPSAYWFSYYFAPLSSPNPASALGFIALGKNYSTFSPTSGIHDPYDWKDYIGFCWYDYSTHIMHNTGTRDNPDNGKYATSIYLGKVWNKDMSADGWTEHVPTYFDTNKTVIYTKANFLTSFYDPIHHEFYQNVIATPTEPDKLLDMSTIDIDDVTYYKDSMFNYTTSPKTTSVGYNKPPDVKESRVDHYELQYNGHVIQGVTKDLPWTASTAPTVPLVDATKVVVPKFTPYAPLVMETLSGAKASGDIKPVSISKGFVNVKVAAMNGVDVSVVTKVTGTGFKGFIADGKFYSTEAAAKAAYILAHSSGVTQKNLKLIYKGKDYQTEADATQAADTFAKTLVTTQTKDVPIVPNYLPDRSYRNRVKSIEDMYN